MEEEAQDSLEETDIDTENEAEADVEEEAEGNKQKKTKTQTPDTPTVEAAAPAVLPPAADAGKTEISRTYIEDCGQDTGYWDITYSDGTHAYIDAP